MRNLTEEMGFFRPRWFKALYREGLRGPRPERMGYFIDILLCRRLS